MLWLKYLNLCGLSSCTKYYVLKLHLWVDTNCPFVDVKDGRLTF